MSFLKDADLPEGCWPIKDGTGDCRIKRIVLRRLMKRARLGDEIQRRVGWIRGADVMVTKRHLQPIFGVQVPECLPEPDFIGYMGKRWWKVTTLKVWLRSAAGRSEVERLVRG